MAVVAAECCRLRAVEASDVEVMYLWENDPDVWRVSGTVAPISHDALVRFVSGASGDLYAERQLRLIVDVEGVAVGAVDIYDFDPQHLRFGIGILIYAPEHRRRGYARAAVEAVVEYARCGLGVKQVWASVAADNEGSLALFEACGFERCGVRRAWLRRGAEYVDVYDYQRILM